MFKSLFVQDKGQVVVETATILVVLIAVMSMFFIYIYRVSLVTWIEYHTNEALYCEQTEILQQNQGSKTRSKKINLIKTPEEKKIFELATQTAPTATPVPKRRNHRCLTTLKKNIKKFPFLEKLVVKKNKDGTEYETSVKWDSENQLKIIGKNTNPPDKEKSGIKDLLSRLFSFFSH